MDKPTYTIDGATFSTLEEFAQQFSAIVLQGYPWNGGLDAFNDILRGGFGTPEGGFVLRWENSALSRQRLGHRDIKVRWFEARIVNGEPADHPFFEQGLADALQEREHMGPLFDTLVAIIQEHGPGGAEAEDGVELLLL